MTRTQFGCYRNRQSNIGYLTKFGENRYKLTHMFSAPIPGLEERNPKKKPRSPPSSAAEKISNSLSRSRSTVWALAYCNPWEYFCTFTIDGSKHNRYDLRSIYASFAKWINNFNSRSGCTIRYLIIPEPHKDGAWHFHGLLSGLPESHLTPFSLENNIPLRLKSMIIEDRQIFNWLAYSQRFGFVTLEPIIDLERCASYLTKYITKELHHSCIELNHHVFYCSHGLKRGERIFSGEMKRQIEAPDFINDYVCIKTFASAEEALIHFCDLEE